MVYVGHAHMGHGTQKLDLKTLNTRLKDFLLYRLEVSLAKLHWRRVGSFFMFWEDWCGAESSGVEKDWKQKVNKGTIAVNFYYQLSSSSPVII